MSKHKETLMWIGGEPEDVSKKTAQRDEYDIKWDKYISGEATARELSDLYTEGDIKALRKCDVGSVVGFSGEMNRMRAVVVHIGYSKKEMESKPFQEYMQRTKAEIENVFGKKNIEIGFQIPSEQMPLITSYGFERFIETDPQELAVLKRRLQKDVCGKIDILDVRINPKLIGKDYFCTAISEQKSYITPGPAKDEKGEYNLVQKFIAEHEMVHAISYNTMKYNPTFFGDGYSHNLSNAKARMIASGNHLEFILASDDGKPISGGSKIMKKVLKVAKLADENIFMVDYARNKHKLLTINPGKNIMRDYFTNEARAEAIKAETYISKAQKIAINEAIKEFLIGEKRLESERKVQTPQTVIKNIQDKTVKNKIKLAQVNQRGRA